MDTTKLTPHDEALMNEIAQNEIKKISSEKNPKQLLQKHKSDALIKLYNGRLKEVTTLFYDQVGDDEKQNEAIFENFNLAWKKTANAVNSTQKHTTIDVFAFEKQIEKYKQIALQKAITLQENGTNEHNAPLRVER